MKTVVIFGGSGFVGRHIIRRIAKNGHKIIIPHQKNINEAKLRLLGTTGQIIAIKFRSVKETRIVNLVLKADVIINLKTTWDEKIISFSKSILDFNIDLVEIIKKSSKINQFIYFSGLGIDKKIESKRSDAIFKSELYIQKNLKNSFIIRPGIIIGGDDQFLKGLLPLFKLSFFIPLFGDGLSKFQPVYIDDVPIGIKKIIDNKILGKNIFEFVGPEIFTYKEFYVFLANCLNKTRVMVPLPFSLVKLGISFLQKTPFSPLNTEQLKLFEQNNISNKDYKNLTDIDLKPQGLREIIKKIIEKNI